ncbi:hypothetical protein [Myxococcus eversor]|uniref:hypothetical protein n=1 Tax=Myxococcus eversor TaxID=2709661 RepID=UPI0013D0AC8F|nr:hypothetical protein [Myxococcus eversor]
MNLLRNLPGIAVATGLLMGCGGAMPEEDVTPAPTTPESSTGDVTAQAPPPDCVYCDDLCEEIGWYAPQCRNCLAICVGGSLAPR